MLNRVTALGRLRNKHPKAVSHSWAGQSHHTTLVTGSQSRLPALGAGQGKPAGLREDGSQQPSLGEGSGKTAAPFWSTTISPRPPCAALRSAAASRNLPHEERCSPSCALIGSRLSQSEPELHGNRLCRQEQPGEPGTGGAAEGRGGEKRRVPKVPAPELLSSRGAAGSPLPSAFPTARPPVQFRGAAVRFPGTQGAAKRRFGCRTNSSRAAPEVNPERSSEGTAERGPAQAPQAPPHLFWAAQSSIQGPQHQCCP